MARMFITVNVDMHPDRGQDNAGWTVSDREAVESGNPRFHAEAVADALAELATRIRAQVVTRFGDTPDSPQARTEATT